MYKISAVVVTFNNKKMLKELMGDLFSQSRVPDEIIVVDNASNDGTDKMLAQSFPHATYLKPEHNTGSSGGDHEGISRCIRNCDFVLTLDDDVHLDNNSIENLLTGFNELRKRKRYFRRISGEIG